jgi:hypothetical protein
MNLIGQQQRFACCWLAGYCQRLARKENDDPTANEGEKSDLSDDPVLSALNKEIESILESLNGVWSRNHTSDPYHARVIPLSSNRLLTLRASLRASISRGYVRR